MHDLPPPSLAAQRAKIARTERIHGAAHADTVEARRDYAAAKLEAYVEKIVASAPPLTEAQRRRIAAVLDSAPSDGIEPATTRGGAA